MKPIFFDEETKEWRLDKSGHDFRTGNIYNEYGEVVGHDAVYRPAPKPEVSNDEKLDIIISLLDKILNKEGIGNNDGEK